MTDSGDALAAGIRQILASAMRVRFLLSLSAEMTIAARDSYMEAGLTATDSQMSLRCLNELQIVVGKQLAAAVLDEPPSYPDQAFLDVLTEKARVGGCPSKVETALRRASAQAGTMPG